MPARKSANTFSVRVKPNHPNGTYARSGFIFSKNAIIMDEDNITEEMRNDPWLSIEESKFTATEGFIPETSNQEAPVASVSITTNTSSSSGEDASHEVGANSDADKPADGQGVNKENA